ncbi:hypothetical protein AAHA92_24008 [Salvia divinorum]|uniref:Uncharacterized protein n=1 Tax=Salvia divinorum TaxID=28513 RepID=A0ABD1G5Z4_SALDI
MADRKSLFSRFWPPSASRRTPSIQTAAAPQPATTTKQTPASQSSTSSPPPPPPPPRRAEAKAPAKQSATKGSSSPATPPRAEPRKASPEPSKSPKSELQTKDEPKTSSSLRPPPSSKPASPSRLSAQSRSPPSSPQARSPLTSPSRVTPSTPKRASKPASPIRATPHSPKGKQPASPSKAPILASKENDPKPAESQQEGKAKEEVKPVVANGQAQDGKSFKHDDVEDKPSLSSQLDNAVPPAQDPEKLETSKSLDDGGHAPDIKLDTKPEDVKEVVEADEKEICDSAVPESTSAERIVEKAEIPSEEDQIHREKQDGSDMREMLATPGDAIASQPVKKSKNIRSDMSKFAKEIADGEPKNVISDRPVSVITLVGENRGASMHMESDPSKRERPIHIHRSYKSNPDQSPEATTDGEESSQGKKSENDRCMEDQPSEAYVNNNAQGINNSIVFNTSIVEGSPGVHMVVSHQPIWSKDETSLPEARKAEVNTSRAEKLTYQPTIRRRCLRGLLLETSDSDKENPRRHGCRVACQKGNRENSIDVL